MLQEQNWWDRGVFQEIDDPHYGKLTVQGPAWKMSETPPRLKWLCRPVGADNEFIYLKYLGMGRDSTGSPGKGQGSTRADSPRQMGGQLSKRKKSVERINFRNWANPEAQAKACGYRNRWILLKA